MGSRLIVTQSTVEDMKDHDSPRQKATSEDIGKMCCLGQILCQAGVPREYLEDIGSPAAAAGKMIARGKALPETLTKLISFGVGYYTFNNLNASNAMASNDRVGIDDSIREAEITKDLSEIGITVEFIN